MRVLCSPFHINLVADQPGTYREENLPRIFTPLHPWLYIYILPVHTKSAGSGNQFPVDWHLDSMYSVGKNPWSHLNSTSEFPATMDASMEPFLGGVGTPQLTRKKMISH